MRLMFTGDKPIVILGAGPAGLTAAWQLTRTRSDVILLEADPHYVGGNARTVVFEGFRFDIGGHRFISKSQEINELWQKIMPIELIKTSPVARIVHEGKYYTYPLQPNDILIKLGPFEALHIIFSYLQYKILPIRPEKNFSDWVTNRFGQHFFEFFFKATTEKMWGCSCDEISVGWAEKNIQSFSMLQTIKSIFSRSDQQGEGLGKYGFYYPRLGPGQMWEKAAEQITAAGGQLFMGCRVQTIHWDEEGVSHVTGTTAQSGFYQQEGSHFISSMPLKDLILSMDPPPPKEIVAAAQALRYRDYVTVVLMIDQANVFADRCLYINEPSVRVSRIQNYKNLSSAMVSDKNITTLGMEYFCFEGDSLWSASDEQLAELAAREIVQLDLVKASRLKQAYVIRTVKAYPIYDHGYEENVRVIREWLNYFPNLHPVGRNGLHRYGNQDHSMMTSILTVRNIQSPTGDRIYDCWNVGPNAEYQAMPTSMAGSE